MPTTLTPSAFKKDNFSQSAGLIAAGATLPDGCGDWPEAGSFLLRCAQSRLSMAPAGRKNDAVFLPAAERSASTLPPIPGESALNLAEACIRKSDLPLFEFLAGRCRFGGAALEELAKNCIYRHWGDGLFACMRLMDPGELAGAALRLTEDAMDFTRGCGPMDKSMQERLPWLPEFIRLISKSCPEPDLLRFYQGKTPLMLALCLHAEAPALVRAWLDAGCSPHERDGAGNTPLHHAAAHHAHESAQLLLLAGADPCAPNAAGISPAQVAAGELALDSFLYREQTRKTFDILQAASEQAQLAADADKISLDCAIRELAASGRLALALDGQSAAPDEVIEFARRLARAKLAKPQKPGL